MLELLDNLDRVIFLFINMTLANPVTNVVMPVVTSDNLLRALYGLTMVLLLWRGGRRLRWLVLFSAIVLVLSDQLSSQVLKPYFARPRPCQVLPDINLLVGCGSGFALPSSHAANAFAQAFLFSFAVRKISWQLYTFAALVAISRVFVGVHYPFDIIAGAVLGVVIGVALALVFKSLEGPLWPAEKDVKNVV